MADIRIGIWGGTGSGKSTYLAALKIAATLDASGEWSIYGQDRIRTGSTMFLAEMTSKLLSGEFPAANTGGTLRFAFKVSGTAAPNVWGFLQNAVGVDNHIEFILHFDDRPGDVFLGADPEDELWTELAECDGWIYLFDPLLEKKPRNERNFIYMNQSFDFVRQVLEDKHKLRHGKFHQNLAVCVTKFDLPEVFEPLDEAKLVRKVNGEVPSVPDARAALELLADEKTAGTLRRHFDPSRTEYFVISSIGFYSEDGRAFDRNDYCNVDSDDTIRGEVFPVSVFSPLVWLNSRISAR